MQQLLINKPLSTRSLSGCEPVPGPRGGISAVSDQESRELNLFPRRPGGGDLLERLSLLSGEAVALSLAALSEFEHGSASIGLRGRPAQKSVGYASSNGSAGHRLSDAHLGSEATHGHLARGISNHIEHEVAGQVLARGRCASSQT